MWFWIPVGVLLVAALLWAWRIDRRHPGLKVTRRKGKVEIEHAEAQFESDLRKTLNPGSGMGRQF